MRTWCLFGRSADSSRRTQAVKRIAAIPDEAEPAAEAEQREAVADTEIMKSASAVRGNGLRNAPSTRGTMFGQFYSPFCTTQEVIKRRGPRPW